MDQVITHLLQQDIIEEGHIIAAFRCFLIAKTLGQCAWTHLYNLPLICLYSVAEVMTTLQPTNGMIMIDLSSGFFQTPTATHCQQYYGICSAG
jgi:hypothetical protein